VLINAILVGLRVNALGAFRAGTHKRAGNVGFRGNSGRGLGIAECPLMTDTVEKGF
jgi:hypothetical protein